MQQHVYRSGHGLRMLDGRQYEVWTQSQGGGPQGGMAAAAAAATAADFGLASVAEGHGGEVHMEEPQGNAVLTVRAWG